MPRALTSQMISELTAAVVRPALLYHGVLGGNNFFFWSGIGDLTWNSNTWLGNGYLHFPSGGTETVQSQTESLTVELSGIPSALISAALQANTGEQGTIYLAFFDSSGNIITDPYIDYQGRLDSVDISESSDTSSIVISYDSRVSDFDRVREFHYTKQSQAIFDNTDLGFDYVPFIQSWSGYWGSQVKKVTSAKKAPKRSRRPA